MAGHIGSGRRPRAAARIGALTICLTFTSLVVMAAPAAAATINVPGDHATIQAAINASTDGDTVVVAPGTYVERINFNGTDIEVRSANGPGVTIIDGSDGGSVVRFVTGETSGAILRGFTIRNGLADDGGGLRIIDASPTIVGNVITENVGTSTGGGIRVGDSSSLIVGNAITNNGGCQGIGIDAGFGGTLTIRDNHIADNVQSTCSGGSGGGISVGNNATSTLIKGNTIEHNSHCDGAGIKIGFAASPTVRDNLVRHNTGTCSAATGGVLVDNSVTDARVTQNVIIGNTGDGSGGGGLEISSSGVQVVNNTLSGNTPRDFAASFIAATTILSNNIIANGMACPASSSAVLFSNNVSNYEPPCPDRTGTNGNISAFPQFVNPLTGNYRLQGLSPSIDTGDNTAPGLPSSDFDGNARVINSTVDQGAFEFDTPTLGAGQAFIDSEAGEHVGGGQQVSFTSVTPAFEDSEACTTPPCDDALKVHLGGGAHEYTVTLAAPIGEELSPGTYTGAARVDNRVGAQPGLDVRSDLGTCGALTGGFVIDTLTLDGLGDVATLDARFEQRCGGALPALFGSVSYGTSTDLRRSITPDPVSFGTRPVGTTSASQTITVTNDGADLLSLTDLSLTGPNPGQFTIGTQTCDDATLDTSESCTAQVSFAPTGADGPRSASLTFFDQLAPASIGGSGRHILLTGTAGPVVPDKPVVTAEVIGGSVHLSWPAPFDGGSPITMYDVYRSTTSGTTPGTPLASGTDTGFIDNSVTNDGTTYYYQVSARNVLGPGPRSDEVSATSTPTSFGEFKPLPPTRILDTRINLGRTGKLGGGQSFALDVTTGLSGIPDTALAVVINITVTNTALPTTGFLTVYPDDPGPAPNAANLNFAPGETRPNLVTVRIGTNGNIRIRNALGSIDLVGDVAGYYVGNPAEDGFRFHGTTPERIVDTRQGINGHGPLGPNDDMEIDVVGTSNGVPGVGVSAVVMNVTVTQPNASSWLTVHPADVALPNAANVNFVPGQTVPNLVVVKVSEAPNPGKVRIWNAFGGVHVIVDVVGYYDDEESTQAGRFIPTDPTRIFDTRVDFPPPSPLTGNEGVLVDFGPGIDAVVTNTAVTGPTAISWLTAYPGNVGKPNAANLNWVPGLTVSNLVMVKTGNQTVSYDNAPFGTVHVIVDLNGYFIDNTFSFNSLGTEDLRASQTTGSAPAPKSSAKRVQR